MDIVKEGTHTYLLSVIEHKEILNKEILDNEISDKEDVGFEIKQNMTDCGLDYYLSVEYEVLKRKFSKECCCRYSFGKRWRKKPAI